MMDGSHQRILSLEHTLSQHTHAITSLQQQHTNEMDVMRARYEHERETLTEQHRVVQQRQDRDVTRLQAQVGRHVMCMACRHHRM